MEPCSLNLTGVSNAWQLGGYLALDGRRIRRNALLRSGKLSGATGEDIRILTQTYNLTTIIDLRTPKEAQKEPDPRLEGVRNVSIPVLDAGAANQAAIVDVYHACGSDPAKFYVALARAGVLNDGLYTSFFDSAPSMRAYRAFFDTLLEQDEGAVLWHCSGGKDRTGLAAVMLLSLLGVDTEPALSDFAYINQINRSRIDFICAEAAKYTDDPHIARQAAALAGVSVAHMRMVFEQAQTMCGSMQAFVQERVGLTNAEIAALREKYLE